MVGEVGEAREEPKEDAGTVVLDSTHVEQQGNDSA